MELLLFNIGELATLNYGDVSKPLSGIKMADREHLILPSGNAILISDGIILKIAPQEEIMEELSNIQKGELWTGFDKVKINNTGDKMSKKD